LFVENEDNQYILSENAELKAIRIRN